MKSTNNTPLIIAFAVVIVLFLFFGGGAITGGMMNGEMNGSGWMTERYWIWTPALLALGSRLGHLQKERMIEPN